LRLDCDELRDAISAVNSPQPIRNGIGIEWVMTPSVRGFGLDLSPHNLPRDPYGVRRALCPDNRGVRVG
jgi:hypothetical protein